MHGCQAQSLAIRIWLLQLAQGETAMQYEEALRAAGYTALDEALRELAAADNPCLEVSEHSLTLGRTKLYVTEITRFRLIRHAWTASTRGPGNAVTCDSDISGLRMVQAAMS